MAIVSRDKEGFREFKTFTEYLETVLTILKVRKQVLGMFTLAHVLEQGKFLILLPSCTAHAIATLVLLLLLLLLLLVMMMDLTNYHLPCAPGISHFSFLYFSLSLSQSSKQSQFRVIPSSNFLQLLLPPSLSVSESLFLSLTHLLLLPSNLPHFYNHTRRWSFRSQIIISFHQYHCVTCSPNCQQHCCLQWVTFSKSVRRQHLPAAAATSEG